VVIIFGGKNKGRGGLNNPLISPKNGTRRHPLQDRYPEGAKAGNGMEYRTPLFEAWAAEHGVTHHFKNPNIPINESPVRALQKKLSEQNSSAETSIERIPTRRFTRWLTASEQNSSVETSIGGSPNSPA
jgi:hypothetical protein